MKGVPLFTRILEESTTLKNDCREDRSLWRINLQVQNTSTAEYKKLNPLLGFYFAHTLVLNS